MTDPSTPDRRPNRPDQVVRDTGVSPRQVLAIVLGVLALIFVFQNNESIAVQLLVVEVSAPLWIVTLVLLAIGVLIGWLLSSRRAKRKA